MGCVCGVSLNQSSFFLNRFDGRWIGRFISGSRGRVDGFESPGNITVQSFTSIQRPLALCSRLDPMGKKKVKKKKKKGVGKKGKKKGALGGAETDELIPAFVRDYVTIHFKLINWSFLDFSIEVCVNNTKLYSLKRKITQRHGRISNLRVYHGSM